MGASQRARYAGINEGDSLTWLDGWLVVKVRSRYSDGSSGMCEDEPPATFLLRCATTARMVRHIYTLVMAIGLCGLNVDIETSVGDVTCRSYSTLKVDSSGTVNHWAEEWPAVE
jgi:hypothetical protein